MNNRLLSTREEDACVSKEYQADGSTDCLGPRPAASTEDSAFDHYVHPSSLNDLLETYLEDAAARGSPSLALPAKLLLEAKHPHNDDLSPELPIRGSRATRKVGADRAYTGLISKNPWHIRWRTFSHREAPYTLDELAKQVDLSKFNTAPPVKEAHALGRNVAVFNTLRAWSYKAIRQGWPEFNQWLAACLDRAAMINVQLPEPLSSNECSQIAKSVAKWTHKRFDEVGFSEWQSRQGAG